MLHLWIINKQSSTSLFFRSWTNITLDPDLISGLLSALNNFSEIELKEEGIVAIDMGGLKWAYSHHPEMHLLLIASGDKDSDAMVMKSRLDVIYKMFVNTFDLTSSDFENSIIKITKFKSFAKTVDLLQEQWKQAELIVSGGMAAMFDNYGVFQRIINYYMHIIRMNLFSDLYDQAILDVKTYIETLKASPEALQYPELLKIDFEDASWSIVQLNPLEMEEDMLRQVLFAITQELNLILRKNLSRMTRLHAISKEIMPFLLNQYDLLEKLDMIQTLLKLLFL